MVVKDIIILGHIYLYCAAMMVFVFLHPAPTIVGVVMPTVSGLLGFTHWFLIQDDKHPDADRHE